MDVLTICLYVKVRNFTATDANFKVTLKSKRLFWQGYTKANAWITFKFSNNVSYVKVTHDHFICLFLIVLKMAQAPMAILRLP